jgi:hypothetical protein
MTKVKARNGMWEKEHKEKEKAEKGSSRINSTRTVRTTNSIPNSATLCLFHSSRNLDSPSKWTDRKSTNSYDKPKLKIVEKHKIYPYIRHTKIGTVCLRRRAVGRQMI